jgi:Short repeat of unknown function (DUF308)
MLEWGAAAVKRVEELETAKTAKELQNEEASALTAFFFAEGLFQVITSIAYRKAMPSAWGWMLASGVCDLILVAIIVAAWPLSAAWTLGLLAGVNLLTSGVAIVMMAMAARDVVETSRIPLRQRVADWMFRGARYSLTPLAAQNPLMVASEDRISRVKVHT